ncbi:hypothetical protein GOP47_0028264 [Adiantum capillus-veneris]|nr:hypothetical protein GOP47_0028264 [Adiantum capillus-veneris]
MGDDNFLIATIKSYGPQYTDKGSGADEDISFFGHGVENPVFGKYILTNYFGQRPLKGYPATADVTRVYFVFAEATRSVRGGANWWKQLWNDEGSGKSDDFTCWIIREDRIPRGYVCLSPCFFKVQKNGQGQLRDPPTDSEVSSMVLVKEELATYLPASSLNRVWIDQGTHADQYLAIYTGPDGVGCFGCNNRDWVRPTKAFPVLNRSKGRLVWEWPQLTKAVANFTGVQLIPHPTSRGDPFVMSSSKDRIKQVWAVNKPNFRPYIKNTYDCEDFAFEMRSAAARNRADTAICVNAKAGGVCAVVFTILSGDDQKHAMNLVLLPDGTFELFEPQTGQFKPTSFVKTFLHAVY